MSDAIVCDRANIFRAVAVYSGAVLSGGHTPGIVDGGGDDGAKTWTKKEVYNFFTQF